MTRKHPWTRIRRRISCFALRFIGRPVADALRGLVRCLFPIGALALWAALIFCGQGQDVLRHIVEQLSVEDSVNDIAFLAAGAAALGLSVWYAMRWMLTVQLPGVRFRQEQPGWLRNLLPRLAGAAVPAMVAVCVLLLIPPDGALEPADRHHAELAAWQIGGGFVLLSVLMFVFFLTRRMLFRRLGQPYTLPMHAPLPDETRLVLWWGTGLVAMLGLIFSLAPLSAPRVIGSAAAVAPALAGINLVGAFLLTYLPMKRGIPSIALVVVAWAVLAGYFNDNHTLRDAPDARYPAAARPDLPQALTAWLAAQGVKPGTAGTGPVREYPIVIVASEGGGIRAAYWTAAVLDQLRAQRPADPTAFDIDRHVFALSGVSGGSVGLASWVAVLRGKLCPAPGAPAQAPGFSETTATVALSQDFLASALAGLFYGDLLQRFWPWPFPGFDRSRGLEEGWQRAHSQVPGQPFAHTLGALYEGCPQLPLLFMNTTVVESGQRGIMGPVSLSFIKPPGTSPRWDRDAVDLMDPEWTTSSQALGGLVLHSARFPVVSPPGSVESNTGDGARQPEDRGGEFGRHHQPHTRMRLVDGGYFDNSGLQTALDLFIALQDLKDTVPGVRLRPVVVVVTNSGGAEPAGAVPAQAKPAPAVSRLLYDTLSPLRALVGVRNSHTRIMLTEARERFGAGNVIEIPMPSNAKGADPALGWALSGHATQYMDSVAPTAVQAVLANLVKAACSRTAGAADCEEKQ